MIYSTSLPYTVPSPQGKAAGVGRDGRLHLLSFSYTGNANGFTAPPVLRYNINGVNFDSYITAMIGFGFVPEGMTGLATMTSEFVPQSLGTGGTFGDPLFVTLTSQPGEFAWLPAGSVVSLFVDTDFGVGVATVIGCIVEDFGQLAQGDEYTTQQRPGELGGFLLTER